MPAKRKHSEVSADARRPAAIPPPTLPPSVEEAYRRKCVQLKNRTTEVEEANDAARLRLARIRRQVEKLRVERAFLLEQLAKRTSTNVEDSEGSPSPPPTDHNTDKDLSNMLSEADANARKPKDKPLRIKRGHRKAAAAGDSEPKDTPAASFASRPAASPSPAGSERRRSPSAAKPEKASKAAFEAYCKDHRSELESKSGDQDINIEEELERGWKELSEADKEKYLAPFKKEPKGDDEAAEKPGSPVPKEEQEKPETRDEDVEMGDNDTEDAEPLAEEKDVADKDKSD